jgi:Ulp1 family protease
MSSFVDRLGTVQGIDVYKGDVKSLEAGQWLTDNIVNASLG